ncbi:MAG: hypothetical protein EOO61_03870 [Hymenobacter sp.]|nr:MAG: hypothetical protein EOO61_03870 [Hymenobacter sp.]
MVDFIHSLSIDYYRNGWAHLAGDVRFKILDRRVVESRLDGELLFTIRNTPFPQIEKHFGRADKKIVWKKPVDALYTTNFIYAARQIRVTYEDDYKTIDGVNIGASLDEKYQDAIFRRR